MHVFKELILSTAGLMLWSAKAFAPISTTCLGKCSGATASFFVDNGANPPRFGSKRGSTRLQSSPNADNDTLLDRIVNTVAANPSQSVSFSIFMTTAGALLGPFLDSYHSAFGVLQYQQPMGAVLWGNAQYPALTTTWWVPELFGLAGFLIGWLYILLDAALVTPSLAKQPIAPRILVAISLFTLQYWLSGVLVQVGVDRTTILNVLSVVASVGFGTLDGTLAGLAVSAATGVSGPLIEVGLLSASRAGWLEAGYRYTDLGETGFFPLWIVPVYFLGGPAVGLLARGIWNALGAADETQSMTTKTDKRPPGCKVCGDTRCVPCPNCDGIGTYVAMGGRTVQCTSCRGRGFVICRTCFSYYDEDPEDIEAIRDLMSRMPD